MQQAARSAMGGRRPALSPGLLEFRLKGERARRANSSAREAAPNANIVTLSDRDLKRIETLVLMQQHVISPYEAQSLLGLSRSQTYKLLARYRSKGASGLASQKRCRPSNHALPQGVRKQILGIIEKHYHDYGPTLATEMLLEVHGITVSIETVRQLMIKAGLWVVGRSERRRLHRLRARMPAYGDLVQVDGSDHEWFESRGPRCTLMVYVDDATSRLQHLRFVTQENRDAYFTTTHDYIKKHGRPLRIVTDKHAGAWSPDSPSEYTLALQKLVIVHSVAHSPQSKGRVERAHRTLQDRLVKALRRRGVSTIDAANDFLPEFVEDYNRRFATTALCPDDHHRPLRRNSDLYSAFARTYLRRLTKQLTFDFGGTEYLIDTKDIGLTNIGRSITIEHRIGGAIVVYGASGPLSFRSADQGHASP